jgi:hypothetical protein
MPSGNPDFQSEKKDNMYVEISTTVSNFPALLIV